MRVLCLIFALLACTAHAQITQVAYDDLNQILSGKITFETLPQKPEPGFNLNAPIRSDGAWLGAYFAGQTLVQSLAGNGTPHDTLGHPFAHRPLSIKADENGENLSVAFHRGFRSNAVLPLGPLGFENISGRGEGALAILFDTNQFAAGFRVHTSYETPLGTAQKRGTITATFFSRQGVPLASMTLTPDQGISDFGFRILPGSRPFAGILISNSDPGGIAIDDIVFQIEHMLF
ncbi:hypothetical protein FAP39_06140 [Shimia litoralis]|uniref:Uncharacterized protein n=1 Tax=Shimia litoralis TaxID=420403 RepID=A0A4U7N6J1_9RHOB|nr:hypothetical protein [Shimia litoralis]TKZ21318.1 hypothetical protein FAP39_06140 [Shimia litoralis]